VAENEARSEKSETMISPTGWKQPMPDNINVANDDPKHQETGISIPAPQMNYAAIMIEGFSPLLAKGRFSEVGWAVANELLALTAAAGAAACSQLSCALARERGDGTNGMRPGGRSD
jgi:hypothetical protein